MIISLREQKEEVLRRRFELSYIVRLWLIPGPWRHIVHWKLAPAVTAPGSPWGGWRTGRPAPLATSPGWPRTRLCPPWPAWGTPARTQSYTQHQPSHFSRIFQPGITTFRGRFPHIHSKAVICWHWWQLIVTLSQSRLLAQSSAGSQC